MKEPTLEQRALVAAEISAAGERFEKETGRRPDEGERRKIVEAGVAMAERKDPGIQENPGIGKTLVGLAGRAVATAAMGHLLGLNPMAKANAKISARGASEVRRWTTKEGTGYLLRSDGMVLVNFGGGWKNFRRFKPGTPQTTQIAIIDKWLKGRTGIRPNPLLQTVMGANPGPNVTQRFIQHGNKIATIEKDGGTYVVRRFVGRDLAATSVGLTWPKVREVISQFIGRDFSTLEENPRKKSRAKHVAKTVGTGALSGIGSAAGAVLAAPLLKRAIGANPGMYEVFFAVGRDGWNAGPFRSQEAATQYARGQVAGWRGQTPLRYKVVPHGSAWPKTGIIANPSPVAQARMKNFALAAAEDEMKAIADYGMYARWSRGDARRVFQHIQGDEKHHLKELSALIARMQGSSVKPNPHFVIDSADNVILSIQRGHPIKTFDRAYGTAEKAARKLGRNVHIVAHPYVPPGWDRGTKVSAVFYAMGPYVSVPPGGGVIQMGQRNPCGGRPRRNPMLQEAARWQSRGGKYWVALYTDGTGWSYKADGGGGFIGNVSADKALTAIKKVLDAYGRSGITMIQTSGTPCMQPNPRRRSLEDRLDDAIAEAWGLYASGVQVPILEIPAIFREIKQEIASGKTLEQAVKSIALLHKVNPKANPLTRDESRRILTYAQSVFHNSKMFAATKKARFAGLKAAVSMMENKWEAQQLIDEVNKLEVALTRPKANPAAKSNPGVVRAFAEVQQRVLKTGEDPVVVAGEIAAQRKLQPYEVSQLMGFISSVPGWFKKSAANPGKFFRERKMDPRKCQPGSFRTVTSGGHKVVVCRPHRSTKTRAQSVLHPTTLAEARKLKARGVGLEVGTGPRARKVAANPPTTKKITMTLGQFVAWAQKKGDRALLAEIEKKFGGYKSWTHGTEAKRVTLEFVPHATLRGTMVTYDMGRQPEALYAMPKGTKRTGLWRHPWEKWPHLKADPESGMIVTKLVKGNKVTDFLHG